MWNHHQPALVGREYPCHDWQIAPIGLTSLQVRAYVASGWFTHASAEISCVHYEPKVWTSLFIVSR